jgi:hypothetical protein
MADRPIIFSAPMVRALLEGRKTQTRRVLSIKGRKGFFQFGKSDLPDYDWTFRRADHVWEDWRHDQLLRKLRYAPGDRLWVREACRAEELRRPPTMRPTTRKERAVYSRTQTEVLDEMDGRDGVRFAADDEWRIIENTLRASDLWSGLYHYRGRGEKGIGNPVPSIHMPRWASRLTLILNDVRVQRLQEISEEDAVAEGGDAVQARMYPELGTCRHWFSDLWNSLHGPDAWDANPWVCALTFAVHKCNIDQMEATNA